MFELHRTRQALIALTAVVCGGCARPSGTPTAAGRVAIPDETPKLGERAQMVARADDLAVAATRETGRAAARLARRAGDLRRRLWRYERHDVDALEAMELYRVSARSAKDGGCDADIDRALLDGELHADPAAAYRALYGVRVAAGGDACAERASRVLKALASYRPLPTVLGEIEREAQRGAATVASDAATLTAPPAEGSSSDPGVVSPPDPAHADGPARITSVEQYAAKDATRIVVSMTAAARYDVGFLSGDGSARHPRLYVDVRGATFSTKREFAVGGLVQRVRLGEQKGGTRVVLDLDGTAYRRVFYLPEPFRLVIDVSKQPPETLGAVERGPRRIRRVVLDPGHGGHDPGAIGAGGLAEKDVTLDVAHRAAPLIARELGVSTLLTRDSDDYVALPDRTARANAFQADLFVSIHCNASEDPAARGVMTFVLDDARDALATGVAARENAASPAAAAELASAMGRLLGTGGVSRSLHFAELLQRAAQASLAQSYPDAPMMGVKRAGFYVLAGAHMPAALFETTFISNPSDEARLQSGDYRQKLADAIVNAVRAYRDGL